MDRLAQHGENVGVLISSYAGHVLNRLEVMGSSADDLCMKIWVDPPSMGFIDRADDAPRFCRYAIDLEARRLKREQLDDRRVRASFRGLLDHHAQRRRAFIELASRLAAGQRRRRPPDLSPVGAYDSHFSGTACPTCERTRRPESRLARRGR